MGLEDGSAEPGRIARGPGPAHRYDPPVARREGAGASARFGGRGLVAAIVAAAVALALHAPIATLTDPDSLYHIRHAWIYRTEGLFQGAFPWIAFSAIEREASNLWYGFHVLLVPFTFFDDLVVGIRSAGVLVTFACLMLVWGALARLRLRWPILWMLVFAFATADSLYRLTMVRPHPLSLGIAVLLFALVCEARPSRWGVLASRASPSRTAISPIPRAAPTWRRAC